MIMDTPGLSMIQGLHEKFAEMLSVWCFSFYKGLEIISRFSEKW